MKVFYKWFDIFLNFLLVLALFPGAAIFVFGTNNHFVSPNNAIIVVGAVTEFILLASFIFGLLYIIIGISLLIVNWKLRNGERFKLGRRILLKGVIRSVLTFVLFFLLSLALSFFGFSDGPTNDLPVIPDPNTPGFPVKDLQITNFKTVPPQISGDLWSCDVSVKNNNTSQTAVELQFSNDAEETNNPDTNDDAISPGTITVINIAPNIDSQTPCKDISITAAKILNPDTSPSPSISPSPSQ